MNCRTTIALLTTSLLLSHSALADLAPPPSCPDGKHNEYLMGQRCVNDGYHLEEGPQGEVLEVRDKDAPPTTPSTANPAPASPPPHTPPGKRGCSCATPGSTGADTNSLGLGLLALFFLRRRRHG